MASKEYLYALVRYNSLVRARGWGAQIDESHFTSISVTGNDDNTLAEWSRISFLFAGRTLLRLFYISTEEDGKKQKAIGVASLEPYIEELGPGVTPILILNGKPSHDAVYEIQKHFPYVYHFNNFIMNESVYNSPSYKESEEILKYLSKSANMDRKDLIVPIRHTDLALYTPTDVVPFIQYMKAEDTIFCTERQSTIPSTYVMINYRYVGKHFFIPREELEEREKRKAKKKEGKPGKKGKKSKKDTDVERRKNELLLYAQQGGFNFGSSYMTSYTEDDTEDSPFSL
jgi:hypothetical protein